MNERDQLPELTPHEFERLKWQQIRSPFNQWVTGEELDLGPERKPTLVDCFVHYVKHDGLRNLKKSVRITG